MNPKTSILFTNRAIQDDPYTYFDWVRAQSPVWREPNYGMYIITGHPEAMAVYGDPACFPPNDMRVGYLFIVQRSLRVIRQALGTLRGR